MKINTTTGTMSLTDDAIPSIDDKNDIITSLTRSDDNGAQFQALCDAFTQFPDDLTNEQFHARCEEWLKKN